MSMIEMTTGTINSPGGSAKMYVFHSPSQGTVRGGKETYLTRALSECTALGNKVRSIFVPSRRNILGPVGGQVTQGTYDIRDGEVLKVFATGNVGGGWNAPIRTAAMYLRVRGEAALQEVSFSMPGRLADSAFPAWSVRGRFDILPQEEAELAGVHILEPVRGHGLPSSVERVFTIKTHAPAIKEREVVTTKVVGGRVMPVVKKRRSLDLA